MPGRTLRRTSRFRSDLEAASQRAPRIAEAVQGAEFTILRNPEWGMAVRGTSYRSWPVHPSDDVTFKIIYSFDEHTVLLRALYPAVPPPNW